MRIAARQDLAFNVPRFAAGSAKIFEAIIMRLKIVVGDAPILNRQFRVEDLLAVTLLDMSCLLYTSRCV